MRRFLVVANRTLAGDHLMELIRSRTSDGPCRFHVVVPATPDPSSWTYDEGSAHLLARDRLDTALERIGELDVEVTGEIGDELPFEATLDVLRREEFDEIILSTLPPGVSKWLGMGVVSRLERATDIPVEHVVATSDVDSEVG